MPRRTTAFAILAFVVAACGAKTLYVHNDVVSPSDPEKVLSCTKAQYDSMGYKVSRYDQEDRRIVGKKIRKDIQRSDPSFYKAFDLIDAEMAPDASGNTKLKLTGHSFFDTRTYRGPTDQEQEATDTVKADMARLAQRCGAAQTY